MLAPALILIASAFARPMMGVEWVPYSRGDAMWVAEDRGSGTGVSELDGWLSPALTFQGGVQKDRWAMLGSLSVARLTTTTWLADGRDQTHVGALRLGLGYRRYLGLPELDLTSGEPPGRVVPLGRLRHDVVQQRRGCFRTLVVVAAHSLRERLCIVG